MIGRVGRGRGEGGLLVSIVSRFVIDDESSRIEIFVTYMSSRIRDDLYDVPPVSISLTLVLKT